MSVSAHTDASLDERNHTPGALRVETRMNWFGGSQKLRASNDIQEPVRAARTLPAERYRFAYADACHQSQLVAFGTHQQSASRADARGLRRSASGGGTRAPPAEPFGPRPPGAGDRQRAERLHAALAHDRSLRLPRKAAGDRFRWATPERARPGARLSAVDIGVLAREPEFAVGPGVIGDVLWESFALR